jgi:hypothetical protein
MRKNKLRVVAAARTDDKDSASLMRLWFTVLGSALLLLVLLGAAPVHAQTLRGVVVDDSTKRPLQGATVTLLNNRGVDLKKPPVRTDTLGRFTIHAGEMGRYQVRVQRIGYQPLTSQNINFSFGGQVHNVTLNMSPTATKLGTVIITGTTRLTNTELMSAVGFDLRKSKGEGKFLDSAGLAEYGKQPAAWLLESNKVLYGLEFTMGANGFEVIRMLRGSAFCTPEVWIDGFQANPNTVVGRLSGLGADQIYGVEVYNGLQLPPPSLGGEIGSLGANLRPAQRCGALAVWSKAYAAEMKAKADAKKPPPTSD